MSQSDFMIVGEQVTLVKMKSPFGPFYTVYKEEKLLGAIERVGGGTWHSLLFSSSNRTFKMPETRRTWHAGVEQLFLFEWNESKWRLFLKKEIKKKSTLSKGHERVTELREE